MGKKKKKKNREMYDFDAFDQLATLEVINDIIDGVRSIDEICDKDDIREKRASEYAVDVLEEMLRRRDKEENMYDEEDEYIPNFLQYTNYANDETDDEDDESYATTYDCAYESPRKPMNQISILFDADKKIAKFQDEDRTMTIDINALLEDEVNIGNTDVAYTVLKEICGNFRPSAYLTPAAVRQYFKNITSFDESAFTFVSSRNDDGVVLGYYISQQSMDTFDEIIKVLIEEEKLVSFLASMYIVSEAIGFSVNFYPENYLDELSLTDEMISSTEEFIGLLLEDEGTVKTNATHLLPKRPLYDITFIEPAICSYTSETRRDLLNIIHGNLDEFETDENDFSGEESATLDTLVKPYNFAHDLDDDEDDEDDEVEEVVFKTSNTPVEKPIQPEPKSVIKEEPKPVAKPVVKAVEEPEEEFVVKKRAQSSKPAESKPVVKQPEPVVEEEDELMIPDAEVIEVEEPIPEPVPVVKEEPKSAPVVKEERSNITRIVPDPKPDGEEECFIVKVRR